MSAVPALKKHPPYDPIADFTPITDVGRYTFFMVIHPSVPANTLAELIQYGKANPGKLNDATGNTTGIVSSALFASLAGIQMVHLPYKGEPQAMTDLLAGRVQFLVASAAIAAPQVREGKLRALAVTLEQRSPALPDVPTIAEAGLPAFKRTSWAGLFGPARMPADVAQRLNREFVAAINRPEVQAAMAKQAFMLTGSSMDKLGTLVREQLESYRSTVKLAGIEPD